ncbi:MAG: DUF1045 domain-containing protein [Anaerolineae bacterium]
MPRFGVFFVPAARTAFYRLGTSIIGYDVRSQQPAHQDNFIRKQLPEFDTAYVQRPYKHGIHCTLVAPQACRYGDLDAIGYEITTALNSFEASTEFLLEAGQEFVAFWGKKQQIVVLQYRANPALLMLHTLLVVQLRHYALPDADLPTQSVPHEYHRIQHYRYPFVFDGFTPHFTLLYPYKGGRVPQMQQVLYGLFGQFNHQVVDSICLMVQADKDAQWTIHREFQRMDFPKMPEA